MKLRKAFTIVEIAAVIAILAILTTITIVGYGGWRNRAATNDVKNELTLAAAAMSVDLGKNNTYPVSVSPSYKGGQNVTVTYGSGNTSSYCLDGVSKAVPSVKMFVSNVYTTPQYGTCAGGVAIPGTWQVVNGTGSTVVYGCTSACDAIYSVGSYKIASGLTPGTAYSASYSEACAAINTDCSPSQTVTITAASPLQISKNSTGPWVSTVSFTSSGTLSGARSQDIYVMVPAGDGSAPGTTAGLSITSATTTNAKIQIQAGPPTSMVFTKF